MRAGFASLKDKKQLKSILLVYMLVATSMVVFLPLTAPDARAIPIVHLNSTSSEDGVWPFDTDGAKNNIVVWDIGEDHHITTDYTVDYGYTLIIPALDYTGDPDAGQEITFKTNKTMIEVFGKFITNGHSNWRSKTLFWGEDTVNWKGIFFRPGSEGCIVECLFKGADKGVQFTWSIVNGVENHSRLISPGIVSSKFEEMGDYGLRLYGVRGVTNIRDCTFIDTYNSAIGLIVRDMDLDMHNVIFKSHGNNKPSLFIEGSNLLVGSYYAKVDIAQCSFMGNSSPGNQVYIGRNTDGTKLEQCLFLNGPPGYHYINAERSAPLIEDCSFDTSHGELSVLANEYLGSPAHPIIRNPTGDGTPGIWGDTFDNSSMNVTGGSSITLQWYMDVYVKDPNGNPIVNAPVWVKNRVGDPAVPPSKTTVGGIEIGWARGFLVTELIQYNDSVTNFNPFTVSAENNSMIGYAKPTMNMSREVTVIVPFNPIPNIPPIVSFIRTPSGIQSGPISIQFRLEDPNIGDNGNMSITVEFWDPVDKVWKPATAHPASPTTNLKNNTLYTFVWDSRAIGNFPDKYSTDIKIKITPYDRVVIGTPNQTGNFTVENIAPDLSTDPVVTVTNTTALIEWTVDEPADASVKYGFYVDGTQSDLTDEVWGSTGSTSQSVQLTDLQPGRKYTFGITSTDIYGNQGSSLPDTVYTFETEIHIQLYKGWNMISIPPYLQDISVEGTLASISGQYDAVQAYYPDDPTGDYWKHYRPGKPFGNDLLWADHVHGLWIHMKNDAVLIPGHKDPTLDPLFSGTPMALEAGWNFVGYPSVVTHLIDDALKDAFGNPLTYDIVQTYDAITGQWLSYDGSPGSLTKMEMGRGYWIHCPAFTVWQVDYV